MSSFSDHQELCDELTNIRQELQNLRQQDADQYEAKLKAERESGEFAIWTILLLCCAFAVLRWVGC